MQDAVAEGNPGPRRPLFRVLVVLPRHATVPWMWPPRLSPERPSWWRCYC